MVAIPLNRVSRAQCDDKTCVHIIVPLFLCRLPTASIIQSILERPNRSVPKWGRSYIVEGEFRWESHSREIDLSRKDCRHSQDLQLHIDWMQQWRDVLYSRLLFISFRSDWAFRFYSWISPMQFKTHWILPSPGQNISTETKHPNPNNSSLMFFFGFCRLVGRTCAFTFPTS